MDWLSCFYNVFNQSWQQTCGFLIGVQVMFCDLTQTIDIDRILPKSLEQAILQKPQGQIVIHCKDHLKMKINKVTDYVGQNS